MITRALFSVAVCASLAYSSTITAEEAWMHIGMRSKHHVRGRFKEHHDLLAFEYGEYSAGTYTNSYWDRTSYIAKTSKRCNSYNGLKYCAGFSYGLMHGYRLINSGKLFPVIIPVASLEFQGVGVDITTLGAVSAIKFKIRID